MSAGVVVDPRRAGVMVDPRRDMARTGPALNVSIGNNKAPPVIIPAR
jgi:hypothetical protein